MRVSWSPGYVVPLPEGHPFHVFTLSIHGEKDFPSLHATAFREARLVLG